MLAAEGIYFRATDHFTHVHLLMYLLCIDDYHLADPLFIDELGRELSSNRRHLPPLLLVHGSGEAAERALEGQGLFRERSGGVLQVASAKEAAVVDRATREANQQLVDRLTDAVLPAVSIPGDARGLLVHDGPGVRVGPVAWVRQLVAQDALPVVSALARDPASGGSREVGLGDAVTALAQALAEDPVTVVGFVRKAGQPLLADEERGAPLAVADLPSRKAVPARAVLQQAADAGVSVLLSTPSLLLTSGSARGRRLQR